MAENPVVASIVYPPSNEQTVFVHAFTHGIKLNLGSDLRYSLTWAYGGYFLDVPKRLGTSDALDAAAVALSTAHLRYLSPESGQKVTTEALTRYSHALHVLRVSLDDPVEACTTNTLCAVYLLLICQVCNTVT